ncbi:superoxide dismutase family protein [Nonomuraea sp. ATR24]|uniref:superoxide dismutase family protein n=1 Tax=Nonomuraea TaxID=83681 RepID=UPI001C5CC5CB|nr:superoxide dismutase family protein [Nonomuraea ceibae]
MRVPALLLVLLAAGCAGSPPQLAHAPDPGDVRLTGGGELTDGDTAAIAYDRKLVPAGAQASVTAESTGGQTLTSLVVEGLLPTRPYGAHLHTKPCGKTGEDAGPHYQHEPGQASVRNEVWLDFTTDSSGAGRATARNAWSLDSGRLPGSLVIHARHTTSSGPDAGAAGDRLACVTLK